MAMRDKVDHALNETRMLILGAQVLLGFQFQGVFQPGFERLPDEIRLVRLGGLGLMLTAVGLLLAPTAFHRIVERGNDSERLVNYTSHLAAYALLPFALGMGIDVGIAGGAVLGPAAAWALGVAAAAFALAAWYGIEWAWRMKDPPSKQAQERGMAEPTKLEDRIKQVLTEVRVVLPGAQALLGFQFAAMLMDAFDKLPRESKLIHLACLILVAATIVLLMAPAAFHRIVERGEDTERLHTFASVMVLAALVPLGLGIAGDSYVVVAKVLGSSEIAFALAGVALLFFYGVWFGLTLYLRARGERGDRQRQPVPLRTPLVR